MPDVDKKNRTVGGHSDIAVALSYDGKNTPKVTAKGEQQLAEQIVAAAEQAGVPLYPDPELAMVLSQIPLGEEIPDNLYKAIAEGTRGTEMPAWDKVLNPQEIADVAEYVYAAFIRPEQKP